VRVPAPWLVRVLPIVAAASAGLYAIVERSIGAGLAAAIAAVVAGEEHRAGVTADAAGIHVRNLFGAQDIEWRDVLTLAVEDESLVALTDAGSLPLAPVGRRSPERQAELVARLEAQRPAAGPGPIA
jgi:hypothetical protein